MKTIRIIRFFLYRNRKFGIIGIEGNPKIIDKKKLTQSDLGEQVVSELNTYLNKMNLAAIPAPRTA